MAHPPVGVCLVGWLHHLSCVVTRAGSVSFVTNQVAGTRLRRAGVEADLDGPCEYTRSCACRRPERACGGDLRRGPLLAGHVDRGPAFLSHPVAAHPGPERIGAMLCVLVARKA